MAVSSVDPHSGFNGVLALEWTDVGPDRVEASMTVTDVHHQPYGIVHGGVYCSIIETICSFGAAMWAGEQGIGGAVGVSNSTNFLRAHRQGELSAVATPIHRGRTYQLWQAEVVRSSDGKAVATGQVRLQHVDPENLAG